MRLPRVVLAIGLTIVLGLTLLDRRGRAGRTRRRATGLALYRRGRFQEAIPYFDQVLARHNRDLEILIKRGACYLRLEQAREALCRLRPGQPVQRWACGVFGSGPHLQHRSDLAADRSRDSSHSSNSSRKAGATAASHCSCSAATKRLFEAFRRRSTLWDS